ncbi:endonuclease/exonuclease/phosphatase family protein [Kitasatospora camelliae]|uniref:Endonuclease/exonuclease/phosphatase family protein n=1 Tax=Kitasatospora camelliae TaxID=3156397 RepID=A0AAU8K219_9ACTN
MAVGTTATPTGRPDTPAGPTGRVRRWLRTAAAGLCGLLLLPPLVLGVVRVAGLDDGTVWAMPMAGLPYVALLAVLALAGSAALRSRWLVVAAALVTVAHLWWVVPRFVPEGGSVPEAAPRLRIATSNAYLGGVDPDAVVRLVRDQRVDVLAMEELDAGAAHRLDTAGLTELMPYRVRPEGRDTAIYSRLPLTPGTGPQTTAEVAVGGRTVKVVAVHTWYPLGDSGRWAADFRSIRAEAAAGTRDAVYLGDFNATVDHAPMRDLLDQGLTDSHAELGQGMAPTFPVGWSLPSVIQIDHVLHGGALRAVDVSEHALPGSDHRAVVAELALTG